MRYIECSNCKTSIKINESIKIDGMVFCSTCLESNFSQQDLKNKLIEKDLDPTICYSCGKDNGQVELQKVAKYPMCDECELKIKQRTLPNWVKAFFVGVILIVIFSFVWNWKYYQAYTDIKKSNTFFEKGDYSNAAGFMEIASTKVPEVEDVKTLSTFFNGIDLLAKDKSAEALLEFNKCKDKLPPDYNINSLIIKAKIGSSFDNKDYEGFLAASDENLQQDSTSAYSWTSVASAYACLYAVKGDDSTKIQSLNYLEKAKAIDSTDKDLKEYYNMVEYRLFSRKILKREDFIKQFPNGWNKN